MKANILASIGPGWAVCDVTGHEVGRIGGIYQANQLSDDEVMEVITGFLGLGRRLYIPLSAIRVAIAGRLLVAQHRSTFTTHGWLAKPSGRKIQVTPGVETIHSAA